MILAVSFVLHVLHALEDAEVPYVIVDGVAVLLHGVSRLTRAGRGSG
jgi:hypothetical protein